MAEKVIGNIHFTDSNNPRFAALKETMDRELGGLADKHTEYVSRATQCMFNLLEVARMLPVLAAKMKLGHMTGDQIVDAMQSIDTMLQSVYVETGTFVSMAYAEQAGEMAGVQVAQDMCEVIDTMRKAVSAVEDAETAMRKAAGTLQEQAEGQ